MLTIDSRIEKEIPQDLIDIIKRQFNYLNYAFTNNSITLPLGLDQLELARLCIGSDYSARSLQQFPEIMSKLFSKLGVRNKLAANILAKETKKLQQIEDINEFKSALRIFRHWQHIRIAWRSINKHADLVTTMAEISMVADHIIECAQEWIYLHNDHKPRDINNITQQLIILAMGKLGGNELNFSSDIDIIFVYPDYTPLEGQDAAETLFTNISRQFINIISDLTEDGFVYRIDARLRPFGESGPLAVSISSMEDYYQQQGREWERYALIKARIVTGDSVSSKTLMSKLRPFIYRRYIDYGVFESLREMRELVEKDVLINNKVDNVKLGYGGIRQVEFIGQSFQLVHGGKHPVFQQRSILRIISILAQEKILAPNLCEKLKNAYIFYREIENSLQILRDQQTHMFPENALDRKRLIYISEHKSWEDFIIETDKYRKIVATLFAVIASRPETYHTSAIKKLDITPNTALELDSISVELLKKLGYSEPEVIHELITSFQTNTAYKKLSPRGKKRLKQLFPQILVEAIKTKDPSLALKRMIELISAIGKRSAYLALMNENSSIISYLISLCLASKWISKQLCSYPVLLDELLDNRNRIFNYDKSTLKKELKYILHWIDSNDLEQQMEALRNFKLNNVINVAIADVTKRLPLKRVSDYLALIAEVVLDAVISIAWEQLTTKNIPPNITQCDFAILGYGKLGGIELGYKSDLDLVFLHSGDTADAGSKSNEFYIRLGQRIYHILNTTTLNGSLYNVDMRLRPSGQAGMLVTTFDAFASYQRNDAWTFEHQALVRARVVAGSEKIKNLFTSLRKEILGKKRKSVDLQKDIVDMYDKVIRQKTSTNHFDSQSIRNYLQKIEFIVQYAVLLYSSDHPIIMDTTDNLRIIDNLTACGSIRKITADNLKKAYLDFREILHQIALYEDHEYSKTQQEIISNNISNIEDSWQSMLLDAI